MDVHFTLQGKGGVGKTFAAAVLAQVLAAQERPRPLRVVDTDPVNATLSAYTAFEVTHLELQEPDSTRINERRFDGLMEQMLSDDADFVVDNGAASFVPLSNYLIENDAIPMLIDAGRRVFVHVLVTGGQGLLDTVSGFAQLADQLPDEVRLVVWLNEYFGPIIMDGKPFDQMAAYQKRRDRVAALVSLPRQSADTFGQDLHDMLTHKLSFDQAIASPDFSLMSRQRLRITQQRIFEQVAEALA